MAQMHKIINLGTLAHDSAIHSCSIDTGVAANFYIVLQHNVAGLQHLAVLAVLGDIAKAIATDYSTGLQNYSIAQHAILAHSGIRIQGTILANLHALTHIGMGIEHSAIANFSIIFHHGKGLNGNIAADFCFFRHKSIGADHALHLFLRTEKLQKGCEGSTRIFYPNNRSTI